MIRQVSDGLTFRPIDYAFMDAIKRRVTSSSALPQYLQEDAMVFTICDAAEFFFEWYSKATQIMWVGLNTTTSKYQKDIHGNKIFTLDGSVQGIIQCHEVGNNFSQSNISTAVGYNTLLTNYNNRIQNGISLSTNSISSMGSTGTFNIDKSVYSNSSYKGQYNGTMYDTTDYILDMYTINTQLNILRKGVYCSFNQLTQQLNILGGERSNIALECFIRIPIENLYNDHVFIKYCVAMAKKHIGTIISTYEFELIGGAKINGEILQTQGADEVEKIETDIKENWNVAPPTIVI